MAWRLEKSVIKGEIDNRSRGRVTGKIWLLNRPEPVVLDLEGNPHRDLAGSLFRFENPQPDEGDATRLHPHQRGAVGDMTASRKVRVLDMPVEEAYHRKQRGEEVPQHMGNAVYLEWYSEANGRVVIESVDYRTGISDREWEMDPNAEQSQREANMQAMREWMERLEELMDADKKGVFEEEKAAAREEEVPPLEPNPLTEGKDWIRNKSGNVVHPLQDRAHEVVMSLWLECQDQGLLEEEGNQALRDMLFSAQTLGAKLAGALNCLAYRDSAPDGGFIVACLKRTMTYLNESLAAAEKADEQQLIDKERLLRFRRDLLAVREEMHKLMEQYRGAF